MASLLSPGVFIEEVPSAVQVVQPVSTSNLGAVGATDRGPDNEATLVTSYPQYSRIFGDLIEESRLGLSMAAFFQNGGKRAYVVRVMPSDATKGVGYISSARVNDQTNIGDGVTAVVTQAVLTPTVLDVPMVADAGVAGVTFKWRANGAPVAAQPLFKRDGVAALVQSTITNPGSAYEGRVITSIPSDGVYPGLPSIAPDELITLLWDPDAATPTTLNLVQVGTTMVASGTSAAGTVATLNLITGYLSVVFAGIEVPVIAGNGQAIKLTFTPLGVVKSISDNGSGALINTGILTADGAITYGPLGVPATYSFTAAAGSVPGNGCPILCDYHVKAWDLEPISVGDWAQGIRVSVVGNEDYYTVATDTYTRYDVAVQLLNSLTGMYDIMESYEELTFTDSTSAQYAPDVINDLSSLITMTDPANFAEGPIDLDGSARSFVIAAGEGVTGSKQIDYTFPAGDIVPRTFSMTYVDVTGLTKTVTDDGAGNLIGDVNIAGDNTISYTTRVIDVLLSTAIGTGLFLTSSYRTVSVEDQHDDDFSGGTNGTFTSAVTYGRSQFSIPTLETTYSGLYALNKIEELMQVIIPDFSGDTLVTKDIMDYCDNRTSLPSGRDRFGILMVPQGSTPQEAVDYLRITLGQNSRNVAMYWPWVKIANPLADNRPMVFPPLGHIAGIYARTDSQKSVGKAPGGVIDGALRFLLSLEADYNQEERDVVYPSRINPLVSGTRTGLALWGIRTTSLDSEWGYIHVNRLFMFVERSVYDSTHWIVFENNGPSLWSRVKSQIQGFLNGLFNDGLLRGSSPSQAFFVIVDETNNDAASIEAGIVNIDVGIAPHKPGEFVRFRFQQKTIES